MRNCRVCQTELTQDNTYSYMKENICKSCYRTYKRERYQKSEIKEKRKASATAWANKTGYPTSEKGRAKNLRNFKKHQAEYLTRNNARAKLRRAIKAGKMRKSVICDDNTQYISGISCKGRIQAHHYLGYEGEHWKDVRWVCTTHHAWLHKQKQN